MDYPDYYKLLGVDRAASDKDIRKAYRKLARQYHPDVNPGDAKAEERFKEINEAYQVLSDKDKRQKYDELGQSYQQWSRMGGQPGGFDWSRWSTGQQPGGYRVEFSDADFGAGGGDAFSDFFRNIFGGGFGGNSGFERQRAASRSVTGQDLEVAAQISLEEAYHGSQRIVQIGDRRLTVTIPAGARDGMRIRLSGQGERGYSGGQNGDLYVIVEMMPHPVFRREGDDLHMDVKIPLYTAVLGGPVRVTTLSGDVTVRIQPGTQSGQSIRLRGKGMPVLRQKDTLGDLYLHTLVQVPTNLSDEEQALFRELQSLEGAKNPQ
ncbi:DnaJ C-terminal domain-containing protein [Aggregatilinea lenta]|uniref:DnaJ C-terminal domain-containing protein n=1 Tax=Aggregatilinea lenta TaxID=913108 RepID=UPI000E5C24ED|nr:J domain-containing protein [Aggregatilinea lenta]